MYSAHAAPGPSSSSSTANMLAVNAITNAPTASSAPSPPPATGATAADVPCRTFADFLDRFLADLPAHVPVTLYDLFVELEQHQTLYGVALLANADIDRYLAMAEHVQILHEEFPRDQIALALHEGWRGGSEYGGELDA
ncbi:hypothetical protein AMAG_20584 [Allomyces macrogynus ATCC 38327]|uniref:Uncharacterized protein n=1 Tax=Allomyces macrogynus (strain ATCC 38327) TaxID=578462 RepID=A0A0L0TDM5_ALLM3|nr:hypothetical protein AMAG_20584 [Allomyces macrogynus ATCC 38327]|eukprot:KNE72842.1 hypothetical protein AMAG_20584 [Allomyces macrogynus ATCC 38327]